MRYEGKFEMYDIDGEARYLRTDFNYIPHFIIDKKYYSGHIMFLDGDEIVSSGRKYDVLVEFSLYETKTFQVIFENIRVGSILDVHEASVPVGKFEVTEIL